jgi:molybdopterin synthase sulfur carrier subunit
MFTGYLDPMPRLALTKHLSRFVTDVPQEVEGATVAEALESAFAVCPALRGYIVDEQGRVRKHVTIFVDGQPIDDRERMTDVVGPRQEVFVMQALSGG